MDITQRFLNYTQFDTQSSEESQSVPSTPKQLVFAEYLKKELEDEGLSDVEMDENGYIYATLKANTKKKTPTIGFISHYDTSPDCKPRAAQPYCQDRDKDAQLRGKHPSWFLLLSRESGCRHHPLQGQHRASR